MVDGGGVTAYFYDAMGELTNKVVAYTNGPKPALHYAYSTNGSLNALWSGSANGVTNVCQYDLQGRLTNVLANGSVAAGYSYDMVGNRTNRTSDLATLASRNNTFTPNDWLAADSRDSNGNTTASGTVTYKYDALNHLTNANNGAILIAYDGDGNRAGKKVGGTTTYYLVDDQNPSGYAQVLEEWTATGGSTNSSRAYNYGTSLINQRQLTGGASTNYFVWNGHGNTRILVDRGANVANPFAYDAYGNLIASNGTPQTAYLYCGQQFDSDLGFYYQRARYMSQNMGRFWTMDTYQGDQEEPLSLHKYLYAKDAPVDLTDPNGLDPEGHHLVPKALWRDLSQRVQNVWDAARNRLDAKGYKLHNGKFYNKISGKGYLKAVGKKLDEFLEGKGKTSAEQLTDEELQEFADEIRNTTEGPIAEYNEAVAQEILSTTVEGAEALEDIEIVDFAIDVDEVAIGLGLAE